MWEAFILESCLNSDLHMNTNTAILYFNSDCWRNCKFCSLCICTSYSGHSSWRTQHYHQAWQKSKSTYIIHNSFSSFMWFLYIEPYILQCCTCTYYITREATYFWGSWLCSMCCGFHHNRPTCSSGTSNWISNRSMGSCYWAR